MASKRPTSSSRAGNEGTYGPKKKYKSPEQKILEALVNVIPNNPLDYANTKKLYKKRKQSLPTKPKGSQKGKPAPRKSTGGVVGVPAVYKMPKKRTTKKV